MLSHLGYQGTSGFRDKGVSLCSRLTPTVQDLFLHCNGRFPQKSVVPSVDGNDTLRGGSNILNERGTPLSTQEGSCTAPEELVRAGSDGLSSMGTLGERGTPRAASSRPHKQSRLSDGFQETNKRNLDAMWANFFYAANIPFSVARNPAFREAVKRTAEHNGAYTPPSYNDLRHKLLEQAKVDLKGKVEKRTEDSVRKFGATLSIDGWSSVTNRPLINGMLVSSAGEQFIGSVDATGVEKDAVYLASVLEKFIETVGPNNVVQVTTDNTAVNPAAWKLISSKYPHIFFQGCMVHALNLMLKDFVKQKWIKNQVEIAQKIVKFIKRRHMPLAVFRKHAKKYNLLMPGKTRFASQFIMIDRLLEEDVKQALQQSVVDPQWTQYVATLRDGPKKKCRTKSREVKAAILDEHFWNRCTNVRDCLAPLVYALRDFDGKRPCMGKVLHIMNRLGKHVLGLRNEPFHLDPQKAEALEKSYWERRNMVETDLHYAGALLNPYLLHDKELADDLDATEKCKRVLMKICKPREYADVVKEFVAFRHREPPFHNMLDPGEQKLSAYAWWDFEGACGKLIAPIAKRILAQSVSSSSCERNWSSYSFVHNKSRNKLNTKRAADLVYVYTNSKVVAASKENDEKKWYEENVESEDSDCLVEEEENDMYDSDGESSDASDANDAMENNMHHVDEDVLESPNRDNEDLGAFERDVFEFASDEDNGRHDEDELPLARFLNGDRLLNSENILRDTDGGHVKMVGMNGTTIDNGGECKIDEQTPIPKSPSNALAQAEENELTNEEARCEVDVEMKAGKQSVGSIKVQANNSGREPNIDNINPDGGRRNVHPFFLGSKTPNLVHNGEGKKHLLRNIQLPPRSGGTVASRALFGSGSTTLNGSGSSHLGKQPLSIAKEMLPSSDRTFVVVSCSDSDRDETLGAMLAKQAARQLNCSTEIVHRKPQSVNAKEVIIQGGPEAKKLVVKEPLKANNKRVMQPFAISPMKKQNVGRTPLDEGETLPKRKMKDVHGNEESFGKAILRAKKAKMHDNPRRCREGRQEKGRKIPQSDEEEDTSSDEDVGYYSRGDSSGAEVKGDSDYMP